MLGGSTVIFVADVITDSGEAWGNGPAKVALVEALQNVPNGLKEAWIETNPGTSCYKRLRAGQRYVIISEGPPFKINACNSTFQLTGNEHILDAIRGLLQDSSPRLVGSVRKSSRPFTKGQGLPQVRVELKSSRQTLSAITAITDGEGRYQFSGLEPGKYQVEVFKAGYVPNEEFNHRGSGKLEINPQTRVIQRVKEVPGEIEIRANSCEIRDLAMWPAGRIQGMVRGLDGKAVQSVAVQVFGIDEDGNRDASPLRTSLTNSEGKYTLQPLASGHYVVGVNARLDQDENPYPPSLYAEGQTVPLGESESIQEINIDLRAPRIPALLRVRVLRPDGKPQQGAEVRLKDLAGRQLRLSGEKTNENGEVLVPAYVGQIYNVSAMEFYLDKFEERMLEASAVVDLTNREMSVSLVLQEQQ